MSDIPRRIVWFSCGAASAVAAKLTVEEHGSEVLVVYCNSSASEHPDNMRFLREAETWGGFKVQVISSTKFKTVEEVFTNRRYMSGPKGAPCTVELKKKPRFAFQRADDIHIFGMTADEESRASKFSDRNHELHLEWPLIERVITKTECLERLVQAGIRLPTMYLLGYDNNNCPGCVKSQSPAYWNRIRRDFPAVFATRCAQSREFGAKLVVVNGVRIFLDELSPLCMEAPKEDLSCGPQCGIEPSGNEAEEVDWI